LEKVRDEQTISRSCTHYPECPFLVLIFHAGKIILEKKALVSGEKGTGWKTIYGKKAIALGIFYLVLATTAIFFEVWFFISF